MVEIVVGPNEPIVACGFHSSSDGVGLPRTVLGFTSGDESDALGGILLVGDGVAFDVVDEQEFVAISELGGQLPTGVGPACCWYRRTLTGGRLAIGDASGDVGKNVGCWS